MNGSWLGSRPVSEMIWPSWSCQYMSTSWMYLRKRLPKRIATVRPKIGRRSSFASTAVAIRAGASIDIGVGTQVLEHFLALLVVVHQVEPLLAVLGFEPPLGLA